MRDIILEVKAEAEAELLMAKAKLSVAESILAKISERACNETEEVVTEATEEVYEDTTLEEIPEI